jgi:dipeptidyl aminopeptidase/acylaminoacyl peptidase
MREISVVSSLDGSREPCLLEVPAGPGPFPLLVGLHTWSFDRFNQEAEMLPRCRARGWALLLPEARGANLTGNPRARQAAGAPTARRDVLDAVAAVLASEPIDPRRVLLLGGSGGGHLALQVAAEAPERFAAISSWCPISDLAAWHGENAHYAPHIAACCGGPPDAANAAAYRERSPIHQGAALARAVLSVHHGRHDPAVPWRHTAQLAAAIESRTPAAFYHEIFDGGHDLLYDRAFAWLERRISTVGGSANLSG